MVEMGKYPLWFYVYALRMMIATYLLSDWFLTRLPKVVNLSMGVWLIIKLQEEGGASDQAIHKEMGFNKINLLSYPAVCTVVVSSETYYFRYT